MTAPSPTQIATWAETVNRIAPWVQPGSRNAAYFLAETISSVGTGASDAQVLSWASELYQLLAAATPPQWLTGDVAGRDMVTTAGGDNGTIALTAAFITAGLTPAKARGIALAVINEVAPATPPGSGIQVGGISDVTQLDIGGLYASVDDEGGGAVKLWLPTTSPTKPTVYEDATDIPMGTLAFYNGFGDVTFNAPPITPITEDVPIQCFGVYNIGGGSVVTVNPGSASFKLGGGRPDKVLYNEYALYFAAPDHVGVTLPRWWRVTPTLLPQQDWVELGSPTTNQISTNLIQYSGARLYTTGSSASTLTIMNGFATSSGWDAWFDIHQAGTGAITVVAGAGVTLHSRGNHVVSNGKDSVFRIRHIGDNEWLLNGDLV